METVFNNGNTVVLQIKTLHYVGFLLTEILYFAIIHTCQQNKELQ
jgi:hypothetical protein